MKLSKVYILVEGPKDIKFITDFVRYHYECKKGNNQGKVRFNISNKRDQNIGIIRQLNGWSDITTQDIQKEVSEMADLGYRCLIIFDADTDDEAHDRGGFKARKKLLIDTMNQYKADNELLEFDVFLFPDNQSNGDLETLLINSIPAERSEALQCLRNYRDCLASSIGQEKINVPDLKQMVYNFYPRIFGLKKNDVQWDFDHESLAPLKEFLDRHLSLLEP